MQDNNIDFKFKKVEKDLLTKIKNIFKTKPKDGNYSISQTILMNEFIGYEHDAYIAQEYAIQSFARNIIHNEKAVTLVIHDDFKCMWKISEILNDENIDRTMFAFNHLDVLSEHRTQSISQISNIATDKAFMEEYLGTYLTDEFNSLRELAGNIVEDKWFSIEEKMQYHKKILELSSFNGIDVHGQGNSVTDSPEIAYNKDDIFVPGSISFIGIPLKSPNQYSKGTHKNLIDFYITAWKHFAKSKNLPLQVLFLTTGDLQNNEFESIKSVAQDIDCSVTIVAPSNTFSTPENVLEKTGCVKFSYTHPYCLSIPKEHEEGNIYTIDNKSLSIFSFKPIEVDESAISCAIKHKDGTRITDHQELPLPKPETDDDEDDYDPEDDVFSDLDDPFLDEVDVFDQDDKDSKTNPDNEDPDDLFSDEDDLELDEDLFADDEENPHESIESNNKI